MNLHRACMCALLAVAFTSASSAAYAGDGSGSANKEADARYEEGVKLLKKNKFEEARVKLTQSFSLDPLPNVALSLAIAEEGTGRHADALRHAKVFVEHPKSDPRRVAEVRDTLYQDLWKKTGHLHVVAEAGADVMVDAEVAGKAPIPGTIDVMPGEHVLRSGAHAESVTVAAGQTKNVDLAAKSGAAPAVVAPPSSASPPSARPPETAPDKPAATSPAKYIVGGTLLGLGVVGFVTGVVFSVQGQSARTEVDGLFPKPVACDLTPTNAMCIKAAELTSQVNDKATLATVFYVGGAVFALGGIATMVLWPEAKKSETSVRIAPGLGSLHFTGTF